MNFKTGQPNHTSFAKCQSVEWYFKNVLICREWLDPSLVRPQPCLRLTINSIKEFYWNWLSLHWNGCGWYHLSNHGPWIPKPTPSYYYNNLNFFNWNVFFEKRCNYYSSNGKLFGFYLSTLLRFRFCVTLSFTNFDYIASSFNPDPSWLELH